MDSGRSSRVDLRIVAQQDGALEHVVQLPHVARPRIPAQRLHGLRRDPRDVPARFPCEVVDLSLDHDGDVLTALAQRRDGDRHDAQPVIQVSSEPSGFDLGFQGTVAGRNDAHVHAEGLLAADGLYLVLLEDAQQLDLKMDGYLADLIEEQRAVVGDLEPSAARRRGAGEGPLHVAEEFALQQALRQGAAVQRDEAPLGPRAVRVDGARQALLADAGFPLDEQARCRFAPRAAPRS